MRYFLVVLMLLVTGQAWGQPAKDSLGTCPLYDKMTAARKTADEEFQKWRQIKPRPELDKKIGDLIRAHSARPGLRGHDFAVDFQLSKEELNKGGLTDQEIQEYGDYQAKRDNQRKVLDKANAAARAVEDEWREFRRRKEDALDKADKEYRQLLEKWKKERDALKSLDPKSPEYLDRRDKLLDEMKTAHVQLTMDLSAFKDCFASVATFLEVIDERQAKIKQLEEQIAEEKKALPPAAPPSGSPLPPDKLTDATLKPGASDPAADAAADPAVKPKGPKGQLWVLKGEPEVKIVNDRPDGGIAEKVKAKSYLWTVKEGDVTKTGEVTIDTPPPASIHAGEEMKVSLSVKGPVYSTGVWRHENFGGPDNLSPGTKDACDTNGPTQAVWHRVFLGQDTPYAHYIRAEAGRYISGGTIDPMVSITWTYVKAK